jgi:hypothetical protein
MPVLSMFYGIIVLNELMADWTLTVEGQAIFKIEPLR